MTNCERQWYFYATVINKNISIGVVIDADVKVEIFLFPKKAAEAHHILESEMFPAILFVNDGF